MDKILFSNQRDNWETPKEIYNFFTKELEYFDPCPINPKFNGLKIEWKETNFVNPPYSEITKWVDKAIEEAEKGRYIYLLVPARTDTKWFRKLYEYGCDFLFFTGRLKFSQKGNAPFPSVLITINKGRGYSTIEMEDIKVYLSIIRQTV